MASAQLMKEELQSNVVVSEGDVMPGPDINSSASVSGRAAELGVSNGNSAEEHFGENDDDIGAEYDGPEDVETGSGSEQEEDDDLGTDDDDGYESESAGDEDDDHPEEPGLLKRGPRIRNEDDEEGEEDEDGEDEEEDDEDELDSGEDDGNEDDEMDADADIIEDAEGVGAVKIRPGETDDEDDSEASVGETQSSDEDWDENAVVVEEEDEGGEGGGDAEEEGASGTCVFCKQDEEHSPNESVEPFLTCSLCVGNGKQPDDGADIPLSVSKLLLLTFAAHEGCAQEHGYAAQDGGKPLI